MSKAIASLQAKIPIWINYTINEGRPRLTTFIKYARVELAPPTPGDIPKAIGGMRDVVSSWRNGRYKQITVKEAWLNTLVAAEIGFWFFIGECIGKRHFIGYKV